VADLIAYLTDLEGMWSRLHSFCDGNALVRLAGDERLELADGVHFVYGGDTIDRGPAGRKILRALIDAKQRYGERVILLAGNRDINKVRLSRELRGHPPRRAPEELHQRPADLLRWILQHTMGAKDAFEHRRAELGGASDQAVTDSFLEDISAGGLLREYLRLAQIAHRSGRTLFVHGGVTDENLGLVPERDGPAPLAEWADGLNAWYRDHVERFCAGEPGADGPAAWNPLILYQAPAPGQRTNPASVVYGRSADEHNNLVLPARRALDELREAGIRRIVVGHTPNGDSPSLVRESGFELLCADNSHARVPDASRVVLSDEAVEVAATCRLDDERVVRVGYRVAADDAASPIGRRTEDGGLLIKGRLEGGDWLLFRIHTGWRTEQRAVAELPSLERGPA